MDSIVALQARADYLDRRTSEPLWDRLPREYWFLRAFQGSLSGWNRGDRALNHKEAEKIDEAVMRLVQVWEAWDGLELELWPERVWETSANFTTWKDGFDAGSKA